MRHLVLGPSKTFNVQCIDRSVKWVMPGYHRLIWLFLFKWVELWFLFIFLSFFFTTNQLHQKSKHQKFSDLSSSQMSQPDPHSTPQSTLHNQHNSRTSNIPIITLLCLCKSKSANRIILILSEKTNNALSKISQLSRAFYKFERKTETQIHTHKPSLSSDSQHLRTSGTSFDSISSTVGLWNMKQWSKFLFWETIHSCTLKSTGISPK